MDKPDISPKVRHLQEPTIWSDQYEAIAKVVNSVSHLYPDIVNENAQQVLVMSGLFDLGS